MLILICDTFGPELPGKLARFGEVTDEGARLPEAEVILVRSRTRCDRVWLNRAASLKLLIRGGVGVDTIDLDHARERGVEVRNTPMAPAVAVAEQALAFMLAACCRTVEAHVSMAEGRWDKKRLKRSELSGKTLGLVGIGNIAREVAARARAFGMTVIAHDPYVSASDAAEMVPSLADLAGRADYVSLHAPLTEETRGMIDAGFLAALKSGAVLVNTGRGPVVDAAAVRAALDSGRLGLYATDVYDADPPSADYPILGAPRVLMAPHLGASTVENLARIGDEIVGHMAAYLGEGA